MQELIFWLIFGVVATTLLFTQVLVTIPKEPVALPSVQEVIPDVGKSDPSVSLVYENNVLTNRLNDWVKDKKSKVIYGLGQASGPNFNERTVKESALQTAYQKVIESIDELQKEILQKIVSQNPAKKEFYAENLKLVFDKLYQHITSDESLAPVFKIWTKSSGEVITYYYIVILDDEYSLSIMKVFAYDFFEMLKNDGIDFDMLWRNEFYQSVKTSK
ncbi:hypothetical protein MNL76_08835 [Fervidobacterium riparium]|uniref:Uncharacterized protein n=1 Tax=Fervidobacterium gondwanense DSM 13020 TaxID=1121883 RepID=A0A1M7TCL1_FERGO|nr:hypothetical protein [Fervidobacterium gondwanense]UXF01745.1 hypothetical protein IB67_09520 [Fervidobacterium riparium]SHN68433.1 hypothetical protein SAMN02745226_01837 [Fervidobacterium gondwanense DSM 13020]